MQCRYSNDCINTNDVVAASLAFALLVFFSHWCTVYLCYQHIYLECLGNGVVFKRGRMTFLKRHQLTSGRGKWNPVETVITKILLPAPDRNQTRNVNKQTTNLLATGIPISFAKVISSQKELT